MRFVLWLLSPSLDIFLIFEILLLYLLSAALQLPGRDSYMLIINEGIFLFTWLSNKSGEFQTFAIDICETWIYYMFGKFRHCNINKKLPAL